MGRSLQGKVVIATHNKGKLAEFRELLAPFGIDAMSAGELGLPEPDEIGMTFWENAALKAHAASKAANLPALADDSGIVVHALDGAPGLFSARWAGPGKNFFNAMKRVHEELQKRGHISSEARRAHFVAALCIAWPDGHEEAFEGRVLGSIVWPPRGLNGFGYDPFFQPDGERRTFGEIKAEEKHGIDWTRRTALSHRARAFLNLAKSCLKKA